MATIDVIAAHSHSSRHRDEIARSDIVGCFYCHDTYPPSEIVEWLDNEGTAFCPRCGIDSVIERKLDALDKLVSQFHEGGANGGPELMPSDPEGQKRRGQEVREYFRNRQKGLRARFPDQVVAWYGAEGALKIQYIEAFEICEYGRRPSAEEIRQLFPFYEVK